MQLQLMIRHSGRDEVSGDSFQTRREQLLDRLLAGEIDQEAYDRLLAEIAKVEQQRTGSREDEQREKSKEASTAGNAPSEASAKLQDVTPDAAGRKDFAFPGVGQVCCFKGHSRGIHCVALSKDGRYAASGGAEGDCTIRLYHLKRGVELHCLTGHTEQVTSIDFAPDNGSLVTGSEDSTIRVWDIQSGRQVRQFVGHTGTVCHVEVAANGRELLSMGESEVDADNALAFLRSWVTRELSVRLWNFETGVQERWIAPIRNWFLKFTEDILTVWFSPDGAYVYGIYHDAKCLRKWSCRDGRQIGSFKLKLPRSLWPVQFAPDDRQAIGADGDVVKLLDVRSGRETGSFIGHTGAVTSISVSSDWCRAVTGCEDRTIRYWDLRDGRELHRFSGHSHVAGALKLSNDGRFVLSGGRDGSIRLWRLPE